MSWRTRPTPLGRTEPSSPATTRNPAHHPRTPRRAETPQESRFPRRPSHRLRQRAVQEAQHRRTRNQPPERLPRGRHPLRETRLHLPRHRQARRDTRHRSDTSTTVRPISMISFTEPGNRIHPNRSLPHRRRSTGRIRGAWVQGRNASLVLAPQFPHVHAVDSSYHQQHPFRAKPDVLTVEVRHLPPLREHTSRPVRSAGRVLAYPCDQGEGLSSTFLPWLPRCRGWAIRGQVPLPSADSLTSRRNSSGASLVDAVARPARQSR
ncbi:hypothetical protein EES45_33785 [Streptomyces sp. ADI97-07]|nr:hypothetical protein EES45_33785 [Streptomyces sp. ADI97-07]